MDNEITKDTIKALAIANGLDIPDARLDRVLKQYRSFMEALARVDAFKLPMEAEPQITFTLAPDAQAEPNAARGKKGDSRGN